MAKGSTWFAFKEELIGIETCNDASEIRHVALSSLPISEETRPMSYIDDSQSPRVGVVLCDTLQRQVKLRPRRRRIGH